MHLPRIPPLFRPLYYGAGLRFLNLADEIEALVGKGVDLSAPTARGGLPALHLAALAGSTSALCAVSLAWRYLLKTRRVVCT